MGKQKMMKTWRGGLDKGMQEDEGIEIFMNRE